MSKSTPVRIEPKLYEAASETGNSMGRSTAQQIVYWARLGRELELSRGISFEDISRTLVGQTSYDELPAEEQAVVRAHRKERARTLRENLRLDLEFEANGQSYVELDDDGSVVWHHPKERAVDAA